MVMRRIDIAIVYFVLFVFFTVIILGGDIDTSLLLFQPLVLCVLEISTHFFCVRYLHKIVLKNRSLVEADIELDQYAKQHIEAVERKYEDLIGVRKHIWFTFGGFAATTCLFALLFDIPFTLILGANFATIILLCIIYGYVVSWYVDVVYYSFEQFLLNRKIEELEKGK